MVLHKDSKWYQSWQNFKENNTYINSKRSFIISFLFPIGFSINFPSMIELFEFKTQYDESDNPLVRATRSLTEKFSSVFGGVFKSTEMSEVLTEIVKVEPSFELNAFIRQVQHDIIPNILESMSQSELDILKDWCTETVSLIAITSLLVPFRFKLSGFE